MKAVGYDNAGFIAAIKAGGASRQAAMRWLYGDRDLRQRVVAFAQKHQGNAEDGADLFHEGLIVLDRNVREDRFRGEAPVQGYLYSICKFLWMNQLRKNQRVTLVEPQAMKDDVEADTPEVRLHSSELKEMLTQILDHLGQQCRKILELWRLSHSMAEIAAAMGFDTDAQARKAKYRCHLGLLQLLEKHPGIANQLKEWV